jgi:hypothetical protein
MFSTVKRFPDHHNAAIACFGGSRPMVVKPPAKRVTHLVAGWRAAEVAPGVVCIEGHQVTSIDTLTEVGVVVEKFDSTDTIEVSPSQLQRAETLARRNETSRPRPDPAPL